MNPRTWLNLALLAGVAVLAGVAYWQPGKQPPADKPALTHRDPAEVRYIKLQPRGGETVELAKSDGAWEMTSPREMPASPRAVDHLLNLLGAESQGTVKVAEGKAGKYGLAKPKLAVTFDTLRIDLGADHPFKRQRYVRVHGKVHLVRKRALRQVRPDWSRYASHRLVPKGAELARLDLPGGTLVRDDKGDWKAPDKADLDSQTIERTVDAWKHRRAVSLSLAPEGSGGGGKETKKDKPDLSEPATKEKPEMAVLHLRGQEEPIRYTIERGDKKARLVRRDLGIRYAVYNAAPLLKPGATPPKKEPAGVRPKPAPVPAGSG